MLNTYFYMNSDTLKISFGVFTKVFEQFIGTDMPDYCIIDTIEGKHEIFDFDIHALNEEGVPYYLRIPACDAESAQKYYSLIYPNDNCLEVKKTVYTGKPMMY